MAIPYTVIPYAGTGRDASGPPPVSVKTKFGSRTISIADGKAKPVRKAKGLAKGAPCSWYEAEDRNLPSVSSF